ncbi:hypothetical protein GCM10010833_18390 [Blastomonas aquatica]|uniref:Uncharacterized protein n=1 Tax=Blastomonas aquatica TaxID=1510276 RepID=A0ABQ1JC76_9SPHN|nr:hypothetical protein GCM10010833_18390 [Blastomonas aquatica]
MSIAKSIWIITASIIVRIRLVGGWSGDGITSAQPLQQIAVLAGLAAERRKVGARRLAA